MAHSPDGRRRPRAHGEHATAARGAGQRVMTPAVPMRPLYPTDGPPVKPSTSERGSGPVVFTPPRPPAPAAPRPPDAGSAAPRGGRSAQRTPAWAAPPLRVTPAGATRCNHVPLPPPAWSGGRRRPAGSAPSAAPRPPAAGCGPARPPPRSRGSSPGRAAAPGAPRLSCGASPGTGAGPGAPGTAAASPAPRDVCRGGPPRSSPAAAGPGPSPWLSPATGAPRARRRSRGAGGACPRCSAAPPGLPPGRHTVPTDAPPVAHGDGRLPPDRLGEPASDDQEAGAGTRAALADGPGDAAGGQAADDGRAP